MILLLLGFGVPALATQDVSPKRPPTFTSFIWQPKFMAMLIIGLIVLVLLKANRMKTSIKVPILLISTLLFGLIGNLGLKPLASFAMHPSPICAATKSMLFGFRVPFIVMLMVIFFLTLVGPKLFCGWICPVGAVQELAAVGAEKLKMTQRKINFSISYAVRLGIFIFFIFTGATGFLKLTIEGKIFPFNIYDYINAFHGFEIYLQKSLFDNVIHFLPFVLTVILAFKIYRPFCHYICPIGFIANFLEQMALLRISLKRSACNDCQLCVKKSPCQAVSDILKETILRPDCYSCDVCVKSCPTKALDYGIKKS
jgi:polyferredoxin